MTIAVELDGDSRTKALQRLKRIEGQARGIQRMIEDGRDCREIMQQLAALRAAAHAVSLQLLEEFALHCLQAADDSATRELIVADVVRTVARIAR